MESTDSQQTQPASPVPPLPIPPTSPSKRNYWITATVVLCILLVAMTVLYLTNIQNQKVLETLENAYESTTPAQTNTTSNETTNWKTYTNTTIEYSFRYPQTELQIESDSEVKIGQRGNLGNIQQSFLQLMKRNSPKVIDATRVYRQLPANKLDLSDPVFSVWVFDNKENMDINAWYKAYWYYPFFWGEATDEIIAENAPKNSITIDSVNGKYALLESKGQIQYIYLPIENKMFLIALKGNPDKANLGNQILSTFTFTNEQSGKTSPGGTYTIAEEMLGDYNTISIKDNKGNIITDDLVAKNEKEIGYGTKMRCMCATYFKAWTNDTTFSIKIVNGGGEEYEFLVDAKTGKVDESTFKRIK